MQRTASGFTLIELMIVVAIIAILAVIALPQYRAYTARADIGNAVAGLAGEKIKVAENHSHAGTDLCLSVATNLGTSGQCDNGVLTASSTSGHSRVTMTPGLAAAATGERIIWNCNVDDSLNDRYNGRPCDNLN